MAKSMVDVLRQKRLNSARRSVNASELRENAVHNKANITKDLIGANNGIDEDTQLESRLSYLYYSMKSKYDNKSLQSLVVHSDKSKAFWQRVAAVCKQSEVDPDRFMKAQFSYFHKTFGTTPDLPQLTTEAAIQRARDFTGQTKGNVVGNNIPADVSLGAVFARCEKQLREMCRAQKCNREEFYRRFVCTGVFTFPNEFLMRDPTYLEVADEFQG